MRPSAVVPLLVQLYFGRVVHEVRAQQRARAIADDAPRQNAHGARSLHVQCRRFVGAPHQRADDADEFRRRSPVKPDACVLSPDFYLVVVDDVRKRRVTVAQRECDESRLIHHARKCQREEVRDDGLRRACGVDDAELVFGAHVIALSIPG